MLFDLGMVGEDEALSSDGLFVVHVTNIYLVIFGNKTAKELMIIINEDE